MNRDDIIRMAHEAGLFIAHCAEGHFSGVHDGEIIDMYPDKDKERDCLYREKRFVEILGPFAALVAAAEREACAKVCEENATDLSEGDWDSACNNCADQIRARGNK